MLLERSKALYWLKASCKLQCSPSACNAEWEAQSFWDSGLCLVHQRLCHDRFACSRGEGNFKLVTSLEHGFATRYHIITRKQQVTLRLWDSAVDCRLESLTLISWKAFPSWQSKVALSFVIEHLASCSKADAMTLHRFLQASGRDSKWTILRRVSGVFRLLFGSNMCADFLPGTQGGQSVCIHLHWNLLSGGLTDSHECQGKLIFAFAILKCQAKVLCSQDKTDSMNSTGLTDTCQVVEAHLQVLARCKINLIFSEQYQTCCRPLGDSEYNALSCCRLWV